MSNAAPNGTDICSPTRSSKSSDSDYEQCIVTYIDVLGFRDLLDSKSAADIRQLLSVFRQEAKPFDTGLPSDPSRRRIMSEVRMEVVSDAVVRVRTIDSQYPDGALFRELLDLVFIQCACVQQGILVRGALTIDYVHVGDELDGPFFGPGLVRAYEMEGREAVYPRIIVEESVMERLANDDRLWKEGHSKSDEVAYVDHLLKTDEAGLGFVDYVGAIKTELEYYRDYLQFLYRHKQLIEQGLVATSRSDVRRKYAWLKNYHNRQVIQEMATFHLDDYEPELEGTPRQFLEPLVLS